MILCSLNNYNIYIILSDLVSFCVHDEESFFMGRQRLLTMLVFISVFLLILL